MSNRYISTSFSVDHTPSEAFAAINDASSWWSGEITGKKE
jgi:hypothetical protein